MRKLLPVIAAGLLFSTSTGTQASGFDLSFSNETLNFEYLTPVRSFTRGKRGGQLESTGLLSFGAFYNELDDLVGHAKLVAVGNQTNTRVPYQLEFGVKGYVGSVEQEDTDVGALAIGGGIKVQFPATFNPIDFKVEGFFTPGITTFGDTSSLLEITARVSLEIVPAAQAFAGYRLLEVEDDDTNNTLELDDNLHIGVRLQF